MKSFETNAMNYQKLVLLCALFILSGCTHQKKNNAPVSKQLQTQNISYAKGFSIVHYENYTLLEVKNPWPNAEKKFRYALVNNKKNFKPLQQFDAIVQLPIKKIILSSTTHIPSLEMLGEIDKLIAFPNLNLISSQETRKRIAQGKITDIGNNQSINTENVINLQPDLLVGFAVDGNNKTYQTLQHAGIPIIFNGDWTENHPLGKAEWIKFFGTLFQKNKEADSLFSEIESQYLSVKQQAATSTTKPTVMSGALWKDIWHLPQGNSWAAQFIEDAHANYLWADSPGTGSMALPIETVIEKAQNAQFWIGAGQFTTYRQLQDTHTAYTQFDAFTHKKIYSFATRKGATGGVIYYELAPNRPDLVLKDITKILHPTLFPTYELYFFRALEP